MSIRAAALGFCTLLVAVSTAQADWGCYGPAYNQYGRDTVPYYSLYPPVYYSYPVPRTYGYSPFAYPPGTMTPELQIQEIPAPKVMSNPYFKSDAEPTVRATGYRGKVIVNPYFDVVEKSTERPADSLVR